MSAAVCGGLLLLEQHQVEVEVEEEAEGGRWEVMLLNGYGRGEQGSEESSLEESQAGGGRGGAGAGVQRDRERTRLKPPDHIIPCPRCQSINTKFCYYNNYSLTQPRHFCKNCRRYWTAGGTLRNVPVGGGCRKNKRVKRSNADSSSSSSSSASFLAPPPFFDHAAKASAATAAALVGIHNSHQSSPATSSCPLPLPLPPPMPTHPLPFDSGIMSHGFFGCAAKQQEGGAPAVVLSNGDLSSILEAHAFHSRAVAAGLVDNVGCYADACDGQQQQVQGHARMKGKSSLCLSPCSGLDEEGGSSSPTHSPCSVWPPPNNLNLNPYEAAASAQEAGGFSWPSSWSTALDLMPSSTAQFGIRSEQLFDLSKTNLVNAMGFGLDDFHTDSRKLS